MRPLFYIHQASCISPQASFENIDLETLHEPVDKKMMSKEPSYEGIPPGILRRMGKAVRIGVGAALPIIKQHPEINGFIIGTANGGMEDCIKFLNQIIQYEEGQLTPGNFVQSTPNGIAAQLGMISKNRQYNITHVHRGLSFENALLDAAMQLKVNAGNHYLLGAVDEISAYNYNIEYLAGWFKEEDISVTELYNANTPGGVAGEGAAMFLVNNESDWAIAALRGITTLHQEDIMLVKDALENFIAAHLPEGETIDLFLSGENGDNRILKYYEACESVLDPNIAIARFKHFTGEFHTATGVALWLACTLLKEQRIPAHMIKRSLQNSSIRNILIYNNVRGYQHSFMLLSRP